MGANLDGVVFGLHAALPALRARGGGAIVATSSLAGLTGVPYDPLYAANKHAVVGLVRSLGRGWRRRASASTRSARASRSRRSSRRSAALIAASGVAIIPAETVAGAVLELFAGDAAGECVVIQPGRDPLPFSVPRRPGPR